MFWSEYFLFSYYTISGVLLFVFFNIQLQKVGIAKRLVLINLLLNHLFKHGWLKTFNAIHRCNWFMQVNIFSGLITHQIHDKRSAVCLFKYIRLWMNRIKCFTEVRTRSLYLKFLLFNHFRIEYFSLLSDFDIYRQYFKIKLKSLELIFLVVS